MANNWYVKDIPFNVELVFKGEINQETQTKLLSAAMHGTEILPGLYIEKLYKATLDKESLQSYKMAEDFEEVKEVINNFMIKWQNHGYDKVMNAE